MSKRIKWAELVSKIPHKVSISSTRAFEVSWVDTFDNVDIDGMTHFDPDRIIIRSNQSSSETVKTYLHEILHAVSDEYTIGLTETQVIQLEKALSTILKPGNVFKDIK